MSKLNHSISLSELYFQVYGHASVKGILKTKYSNEYSNDDGTFTTVIENNRVLEPRPRSLGTFLIFFFFFKLENKLI